VISFFNYSAQHCLALHPLHSSLKHWLHVCIGLRWQVQSQHVEITFFFWSVYLHRALEQCGPLTTPTNEPSLRSKKCQKADINECWVEKSVKSWKPEMYWDIFGREMVETEEYWIRWWLQNKEFQLDVHVAVSRQLGLAWEGHKSKSVGLNTKVFYLLAYFLTCCWIFDLLRLVSPPCTLAVGEVGLKNPLCF